MIRESSQSVSRRRSRELPLVRLGWSQWIATVAGVVTMLVVMLILAYPAAYDAFLDRVVIPTYERRFGFEWGTLFVRLPDGRVLEQRGVVRVVPQGIFDRQGVKPGDLPFGYHSGTAEMYGALSWAASGQPSSFEVVNVEALSAGRFGTREISLPGS